MGSAIGKNRRPQVKVKRNTIAFWMIVVAACAIFLWLPKLLLLLILVVPVCSTLLYCRFVRKGFLGGVIGGVIGGVSTTVLFCICTYIYNYLKQDPNMVDYMGPGLTFLLFTFLGTIFGAAVGLIVMVIKKLDEEDSRKRKQMKLDRLNRSQGSQTAEK